MTKSDLKKALAIESEDLRQWFVGALSGLEARSTDEISKIGQATARKFLSHIGSLEELHLLWRYFEDFMLHATEHPEILKEEFDFKISPNLELPEYALFVGLVLAERAAILYETDSHKNHLMGSLCYAAALEARGYWSQCRGITGCRVPDAKSVELERIVQSSEFHIFLKQRQSQAGRRAAISRHSQTGGSHDKRKKIREIWASGKYPSRDICAQEECGRLGMSFSTARKALKNTPEPIR